MTFARLALAFAAPLLLTACLFAPGKFTSNMDVAADGAFSFVYKGEIVFLPATDAAQKTRGDNMGISDKCYGPVPGSEEMLDDGMSSGGDADNAMMMQDDGATPNDTMTSNNFGFGDERPCTAEETAEKAKQKVESAKREKDEMAKMSQVFGLNPEDPKSIQSFVDLLAKQDGWKSVKYRGDGVFDVDFAITSTLDRDFVFPVYPRVSVIYPMVIARRRGDGTVQITAPAFIGAQANLLGSGALFGMAAMDNKAPDGMPTADGVFTLTTKAEVLTNNTEDGPVSAGGGKTLKWVVNAQTPAAPEALVKLTK